MPRKPVSNKSVERWPTLDEQFASSKVIRGSALEQLIRSNQDFSMLRPEEAHDKLGLPLWLRVYWRKKHPDGVYAGPSGGYPLLLREYHEWMVGHQDLSVQTDSSSAALPKDQRHGR
jgi:hypothetical protein